MAFGRYRYVQFPFGVVQGDDMFQKKKDEFFSDMSNVFSIADYILTAGFKELGRDHDVTLDKVLRICRQVNLKTKKDKQMYIL